MASNEKGGYGNVDLTFNKVANYMDKLERIADWFRGHNIEKVRAISTGMAGALRVKVPKLKMQIPFVENDEYDIEKCFSIISTLIDAVNIFSLATEISDLK